MDMRGGLGELLRSRRVTAGLTQEELAERSGLGVRTISHSEREHGGSLVIEPFALPGVGRGLLRHRPARGPDPTHARDPRA
jgi:hypothetical protein